jgi:hypothetical protein
MQTILLAMNDSLLLVVGIPAFLIVWTMVYEAFKEMPLFYSRVSKVTLATCVALLSIIGIFHYGVPGFGTADGSGDSDTRGRTVHFILLPYAALGLAMVLIALFLYGSRLWPHGRTKAFSGHLEDQGESHGGSAPGRGDWALRDGIAKAHDRRVTDKDTLPGSKPGDRSLVKRSRLKTISDQGKSNRTQQ